MQLNYPQILCEQCLAELGPTATHDDAVKWLKGLFGMFLFLHVCNDTMTPCSGWKVCLECACVFMFVMTRWRREVAERFVFEMYMYIHVCTDTMTPWSGLKVCLEWLFIYMFVMCTVCCAALSALCVVCAVLRVCLARQFCYLLDSVKWLKGFFGFFFFLKKKKKKSGLLRV